MRGLSILDDLFEWAGPHLSDSMDGYTRTVPIGKPITTIAHNTSATSLYISWKPPPPDTILGEFLGYRITYRTRDKHHNDLREIYIRDSNVEVRNVGNPRHSIKRISILTTNGHFGCLYLVEIRGPWLLWFWEIEPGAIHLN